MSDQTLVADPPAQDITAQLQERVRSFTAFYEQHAYLAYNLALRITCEPEGASSAVQRGFLAQLDEPPPGLVAAIAGAALDEAGSNPEPSGAGDAEAETLLGVVATLAPAERAALALADLAHAGPDAVGQALGVGGDQAAKLLHRGREGFAARLGLPRTQADVAARDWMWAAPPQAIWEDLYSRFHQAVERQLRRGASQQTLVLTADEAAAVAAPPAARPRKRRLRFGGRSPGSRRRRRRRGLVLLAVAALGLGGLAAAAWLVVFKPHGNARSSPLQAPEAPPSGDSAPPPTASATGGDPAVTPHKPLTPAQLDKLRLNELRQLNVYNRRQADRRLSAPQRAAAAHGIAGLQQIADQRLKAALMREQQLRQALARERARHSRPQSTPQPAPRQGQPAPSKPKPQGTTTTPSGTPQNKRQADQTCLFNQDTGTYVCQQ